MLAAKPQPMEAAAKIPTPHRNINRRPNKSPREPPTRIKAPKNNPYDSTTHCTPTTVAWRLVWSAGRATLTTVLSIKAILEPRIVAARPQRPAVPAHGTSAVTDRTTVSSHAGFMKAIAERTPNYSRERTLALLIGPTE